MRRVTGRSLLLLLAFTLVAPPAFADDDEILRGADLVDTPSGKAPDAGTQRRSVPAQGQQGRPVDGQPSQGRAPDGTVTTNGNGQQTAPNYETDLKETIDELQEEVYKLREEMDQLKALREKDRAAFDQRIAEINRQLDQRGARPSPGMSGRIDEIDRGIQNGNQQRDSQGRLPNDPNYGRDAYGRAPSDPNFGRAPNQTTPNGQQGEQKMNFWQKLLLAVLDGVGKGLAAVSDRKMSELQNRSTTATNNLNTRYPDRSTETTNRVNTAIEDAWRNGRISRAPVNAPIYTGTGADVRVVARGNNGDVVSVNGNLTLLPRVTDEAGTHPVINLPLGVGD